jgi:HEAT repeat protein
VTARLRDRRAAAVLLEATYDQSDDVVRTATQALGFFPNTPGVVERLLVLLEDERPHIPHDACRALGTHRDRRAVQPIIALNVRYPHAMARLVGYTAVANIGSDEAIAYLADALMKEQSDYVRSDLATLLATSSDPRIATVFDRAGERRQLEVVAGAFEYFLARQPHVPDELMIAAFHQYGGQRMGDALKKSGRPLLREAVEQEERSPIQKAKMIEVPVGR